MAMNKTHTFSPSVSLAAAKTMDMSAVITAIKLIHNQATKLGYQCHLTVVGDKFLSPICVVKTSGRLNGKDYRCLYWVFQGGKHGSNYWLSFINVWEKDSSTTTGLKCCHSLPIDFSKCASLPEVSNEVVIYLNNTFTVVNFN
jgi:hypothetical protein